ncbi:MAG TPA: hypothetical protein VLI92_05150 [Candidatus Saccharimonadales bacterium]|nr:hypothetical protein [Candidatus Saccharimonadales bacterium]
MKRIPLPLLIIVIAVLIISVEIVITSANSQPLPDFHSTSRTKTSNCHVYGALPDKECTPGAVFPNITPEIICVSGYTTKVRNVPTSEKNAVFAEYGITSHKTGEYEVDHFISLELGGSNDISNLFPEAAEPKPGFHQKDVIENYLHAQVCNHKMTLAQAQQAVSWDWLKTYDRLQPGNPLNDIFTFLGLKLQP